MGTHWEISIWDKLDSSKLSEIQKEIIFSSEEFDQTYSRFKESSLVSSLSTKTGHFTVPSEFIEMLKLYFKLYKLSNKKFTPLVGSSLSDLGYDAEYSLKEKGSVHPVEDLDKAVKIIDHQTIELYTPSLFDFGALGKGYFVEKIKNLLNKHDLKHLLVNGSGDISYQSHGEPIAVGLEHPFDQTKVIGKVEMTTGSMCSSGSNRRAWGIYHHILDPDSLTSPTEIIASWVIASSATIADALATALFLSPPEAFAQDFKFEYLLLNKDMKVKRSKGFAVELF